MLQSFFSDLVIQIFLVQPAAKKTVCCCCVISARKNQVKKKNVSALTPAERYFF